LRNAIHVFRPSRALGRKDVTSVMHFFSETWLLVDSRASVGAGYENSRRLDKWAADLFSTCVVKRWLDWLPT